MGMTWWNESMREDSRIGFGFTQPPSSIKWYNEFKHSLKWMKKCRFNSECRPSTYRYKIDDLNYRCPEKLIYILCKVL